MSALIGIQNLTKSYGSQNLFEKISFSINSGDRIGIIGPNGSGKSTLLKVLMGIESPNEGKISKKNLIRIGYASQEPEFSPLPIEDLLAQSTLEGDEHERHTKARILLGKAGFVDTQQNAQELSGGWKKRLDIARALMLNPDLLLLDEPTNHLDLEGILWLEQFLQRERISYLVISHDRYFLENVTNRIIELNRCYPQGIFECVGTLSTFLEKREDFLTGQLEQERALKGVVKDEIDWLRRSPKARTTKSVSRIKRAHSLMDDLSKLKNLNKKPRVNINFAASERETRKLLTAKNLSKSLGDKQLFKGVDITLSPGTRLGIVGENGTGKTTLLRVLAGQLKQDAGNLKYAEDLKLVYFDQHREQLPSHLTLREALSPNGETVFYLGRQIHVSGWAKKFLFSPDRLELPISCLSGGERARIHIARLMQEPADILFLDEPTNDLDIPTLEVIEESLKEFPGAVVLISHDRCLMDRTCTEIIGLGKNCENQIYADYSQWEEVILEKKKPIVTKSASPKEIKSPKKLTYSEQIELEKVMKEIEATETALADLQSQLENPQNPLKLYQDIGEAEKKLDQLFKRWEALEDKRM